MRIRIDETGSFLHSAQFQDLADADAVRDRADMLARILSGACRLGLGSDKAIAVACVHRSRGEGGPSDTFVRAGAAIIRMRVMPPSIQLTHPDGTTEIRHPADPLVQWVGLASVDQPAAKLLRLLDVAEPDFVDLYRIFELIEGNVGDLGVADRGWCPKEVLERFKRTANSPGAAGDLSRHGWERTDPPPVPVSLEEARVLVHRVAEEWLAWKCAL